MSNLRTIVLIFAIGMFANTLHSIFFSIDEQIASESPETPNVDTHNFKPDTQSPQIPAEEEEELEYNAVEFDDENEKFFDEAVDSDGQVHTNDEVIDINKGKRSGYGSNTEINILYCVS
mmetsp:Transcript_9967/g.11317  ORF Transcript_9967/g.11317 Transcript_9967/m.11317 type:complete len:119 (-) Transcript_9967:549-905(-)